MLVSNVQQAWRAGQTKPVIHTDIVDLLAQELVEEFAEYLYFDIRSLKNCSHVCRSWRAAFARVLFRTVTVERPVAAEIDDVLMALKDFLDKTPHIARHVYVLSLSSATESTPPDGTSLTVLRRVMAKTPRLRFLTVDVALSDIYSILTPSLPSNRLHRLEIGSLVLDKQQPEYLSRLLPLLPPADELIFSSPRCNLERRRLHRLITVEGSQPLCIKHLTFTEPCGYQSAVSVLDLLPHITDMASLTRLSLSAPLPGSFLMEAVTHIATLATNLVDIHIAFNVCNKVEDGLHHAVSAIAHVTDIEVVTTMFAYPPNLSPCSSLRHLSVSFDVFARGFIGLVQNLAQWRRAITQLRRSPAGLKSLRLSITVPWSGIPGSSGMSIVASLPWDTLDAILRRFNALERVAICIVPARFANGNESPTAEVPLNLRDIIRERFSPENAGLLHVTFSEGNYEEN